MLVARASSRKYQMKKKNKGQRGVGWEPPQPGTLDTSLRIDRTFRFQASSAGVGTTITNQNLLQILSVGISSTQVSSILQSARLKRITMWGPPASNLAPVTVSCQWGENGPSGFGGNAVPHSDTSVGSAYPAYLSVKPPEGTLPGMWMSFQTSLPTTAVLCLLDFPANAIIDLQVNLVVNSIATTGPAQTVSSSVLGTIYLLRADGVGGTLVPVNMSTAN